MRVMCGGVRVSFFSFCFLRWGEEEVEEGRERDCGELCILLRAVVVDCCGREWRWDWIVIELDKGF